MKFYVMSNADKVVPLDPAKQIPLILRSCDSGSWWMMLRVRLQCHPLKGCN